MKIKKQLIIILIMIFIINIFIYSKPSYAAKENADFPIYSEGAVLMESSTGKVLYGKNENGKLYPASTTKVLTAIIVLENLQLTDKLTASKEAVMAIPAGYSNAAIQPEEVLTCQELLDLFLIHSANEAGFIFAEHISGSVEKFAELMNQKAAQIGCKNTHFTNPSGIHDPEHYTTAYDLALITRYCMKNETFRNIVSRTSCTVEPTEKFEKRYFRNTNDLLIESSQYYYKYAIGVKTGFTTPAKNCLIAASKKDEMELIVVALGAEATEDGRSGRYVDSINLFEYGFSNYKIQQIAEKDTVIHEMTVENGTKDTKNLQLVLKNSLTGLTPADLNLNNLKYTVDLKENISAPIAENDVLGKITYEIDDNTYSVDLVASHSVEESNLLLLIGQALLALFVLFILTKLIFSKKKLKKNNKNKKSKKHNKKVDSIYKFN